MTQLELVYPTPLHLFHERRGDHEAVAALVMKGASVLDVGCGDGALIRQLTRACHARARGLEIDPVRVHGWVARGLSGVQGDAEGDLEQFAKIIELYMGNLKTLYSVDLGAEEVAGVFRPEWTGK